jgi:hypothetical protein
MEAAPARVGNDDARINGSIRNGTRRKHLERTFRFRDKGDENRGESPRLDGDSEHLWPLSDAQLLADDDVNPAHLSFIFLFNKTFRRFVAGFKLF